MSLYTDYPAAIQRPPKTKGKVYGETNRCEGVIEHSAEGYRAGLESQIDGPDVSWHFSILKDGTVWQHYPLYASCWHAGSREANQRLIGVEHEGTATEPLTEAQVVASVALTRWIGEQAGWAGLVRGRTLYEHREVNPATQCPSGRIPWHRYTGTLPGGEFLPEPVEETDIGKIATDLVYGVKAGRVDLIEHGPSPKRAGWTRLVVDYMA